MPLLRDKNLLELHARYLGAPMTINLFKKTGFQKEALALSLFANKQMSDDL